MNYIFRVCYNKLHQTIDLLHFGIKQIIPKFEGRHLMFWYIKLYQDIENTNIQVFGIKNYIKNKIFYILV